MYGVSATRSDRIRGFFNRVSRVQNRFDAERRFLGKTSRTNACVHDDVRGTYSVVHYTHAYTRFFCSIITVVRRVYKVHSSRADAASIHTRTYMHSAYTVLIKYIFHSRLLSSPPSVGDVCAVRALPLGARKSRDNHAATRSPRAGPHRRGAHCTRPRYIATHLRGFECSTNAFVRRTTRAGDPRVLFGEKINITITYRKPGTWYAFPPSPLATDVRLRFVAPTTPTFSRAA